MRNDAYTNNIIDNLQNEMYNLIANKIDGLPKLMQQALTYLQNFGSKFLIIAMMVNIQ